MKITIIELLKKLSLVKHLSLKDWESILSDAREQKVVGRLCYLLKKESLFVLVPDKVQPHLLSALTISEQQKRNVDRELTEIAQAFSSKGEILPILLKGAAYSHLNLPCCFGRSYNDIDLLVAKPELRNAEIALMLKGWVHKKEEEYDKEYYQKWMHEIQPMIHNERLTVIDLHHSILPLTNRSHFAADKLETVYSKNMNVATLSPVDMFIHCSLHLFTEGEFSHPLRDLTDLSMLFSVILGDNVQEKIESRASELDILNYIDLALVFCAPYCQTAIDTRSNNQRLNNSFIQRFFIMPAFRTIFDSPSVTNTSSSFKLSSFILYVRGHLLRMPLRLLIPHLIKKAVMRKDQRKAFGKDWN